MSDFSSVFQNISCLISFLFTSIIVFVFSQTKGLLGNHDINSQMPFSFPIPNGESVNREHKKVPPNDN